MAVTWQGTLSGAAVMLHTPSWRGSGSGLRGVICQHGHGGADVQIEQGGAFNGHAEQLADKGYAVACISTGNTWLNAAAMTLLTALYTYLTTTVGVAAKVGLMGWSMGGGNVLRWLVENPTLVAVGYLFSPVTDLDWAHAQSAWTAEMDTAYDNNYASTGSPRSPVTTAASFRGGPKLRIAHATDDATVSYSQTTAFIAAVNDPAVSLRTPAVTGDHQGALLNVPPRESWEFIRTNWAA